MESEKDIHHLVKEIIGGGDPEVVAHIEEIEGINQVVSIGIEYK